MKFLPRLLASLLPCFLLAHCSKGIDQTEQRTPVPAKPLLTWAELLPNKPPLPADEVGMDLVLLRVPMATAAAALLQDQGGISGAETLLQAVLADGATSVVTKASVAGPEKQQLHFNDVKEFTYCGKYGISFQWEREQTAKEGGEAPPDNRDLDEGKMVTPIGTKLDAILERDGNQLQAGLDFEWMPEPLRRPCNSWPVKQPGHDFTPVFQPWTFKLTYCLNDEVSLLAAIPEAPGSEGSFPHSGSMLMAFARAKLSLRASMAEFTEPKKILVRSWTYELPADKGEKLLRSRAAGFDDSALLKVVAGDASAILVSCSAVSAAEPKSPQLASGGTEERSLSFSSRISSALKFFFPSGFEPPYSKEFQVVCDDETAANLQHEMEIRASGIDLELNISGNVPTSLHWERWHGSTLGAKDEPVGVETPVFGKDEYHIDLVLGQGVAQVVRAGMIDRKLRLTFVDWIHRADKLLPNRRGESEQSPLSQTLRIIETPLHPWLEHLAQLHESALLGKLEAALDSGNALLLNLSWLNARAGSSSTSDSGVGYLNLYNYLNTSIRGDHLFYNPRFVALGTSGLRSVIDGISAGEQTELSVTLNLKGLEGNKHYALWLPHSPLHSRTTSGIDRPIILNTNIAGSFLQTDGGDYLLGTCLVPASTFRKEPALRWFTTRGSASSVKSATLRPAESSIEFSVISSAEAAARSAEAIRPNPPGMLLAHGTVRHQRDRFSLFSGLIWDSLEPRSLRGSDDSSHDPTTEKIPEGTRFEDQPSLTATPCGFTANIDQEKWAATYQSDPRFTTDTLKTHDETPRKNPVMEANIPVSCERALYEPIATAGGSLPPLGMQITTRLGQGRLLIVRHHAGR